MPTNKDTGFDAGDVDRAIKLYAEALQIFDVVGGSESSSRRSNGLRSRLPQKGRRRQRSGCLGDGVAAREALHLPPRLESDEQRVASGLAEAMQAAGTGAMAVLSAGRSVSLDLARDEALELAAAVAVSSKNGL